MRRLATWIVKTGAAAFAAFTFFGIVAIDAHAQFTGVWTLQHVSNAPSQQPNSRSWTEMIFDPVASKPVLFGGSGGTYRNDILDLDLANQRWIDVELYVAPANVGPYGPPCPRDSVTFTYDPVNTLYWVIMGNGYNCGARSSTAGPGTAATQIVDTTLPSGVVDYYKDYFLTVTVASISYRAYITAYDPVTKTLTLSPAIPALKSGLAYQIRSQPGQGTWSYSPATRHWRGFEAPSFGYTGPKPVDRLVPGVAYSDADQAIVMFGGGPFNDTWALDATTQTWIQMIPDGSPTSPARRTELLNSMIYDPVDDVFVLFGGQCHDVNCAGVPYNGGLGDTWTYRLSTNTWTQMHPAQSPSPRYEHSLTYDPVNKVMVLFGGRDATNFFGDTWIYDVAANTWTPLATTGDAPGLRFLHMMVYDPSSGQHVLYGGATNPFAGVSAVHTLKVAPAGGNLPPVASFTVTPNPAVIGTPMAFNGTASSDPDGSIVSYAWDFGDGSTATGSTTTYTYAATGTFVARLTVTDDGGLSTSTTRSVTVTSATPAPDILYTKKIIGSITNGGSVTSVVAGGSAVPFNNGTGGAYDFTLTVSVPTSVSVTINASGPGGTTTETIVVSVP